MDFLSFLKQILKLPINFRRPGEARSGENRLGSTRPLVNCASDQLLSRATLTRDQNRCAARRNSEDLRRHAADRLRGAYDLLEYGRRENVVVEKIEHFFIEASW